MGAAKSGGGAMLEAGARDGEYRSTPVVAHTFTCMQEGIGLVLIVDSKHQIHISIYYSTCIIALLSLLSCLSLWCEPLLQLKQQSHCLTSLDGVSIFDVTAIGSSWEDGKERK